MRFSLRTIVVVGVLTTGSLLPVDQAFAGTVDLVNGDTGTSNGAIYTWVDQQSTGTGVIDPFLRIQGSPTEQGYNTSYSTPWETKAGTWTHELQMSDLVVKTIDGVDYYEFLLDINQVNSQDNNLLSLNNVKIYTSPTLSTTTSDKQAQKTLTNGTIGTLRFNSDVGANGDTTVNLDYNRNPGSGAGDMLMYVPTSLFAGAGPNDYVYFYSLFGNPNYASNDGFEEWALLLSSGGGGGSPSTVVPEPSTLLLLGTGVTLVAARIRRKA